MMLKDIAVVMWKERNALFLQSRGRFATLVTFLVPLAFAVWLSWDAGDSWLTHYLPSTALMYVLPVILISAIVPDSIAGERERKTLETLLASRLPDRAILFGKLSIAIAYGWAADLLALLVALTAVNAAHWSGRIQFYSPAVLAADLCLGLLFSTLIAALGTLVSLRARGVRQAQQMLSGIFIFPVLVVWVVFNALGDRLPPPPSLDASLVVLIVAAVLILLSATLMLLALRSFRRGRLLVD